MDHHLNEKMENFTAPANTFRVFLDMDISIDERVKWMERNWSISIYAVFVYLAFIYFGQRIMKNRKPFDLQTALVVWNFALAAFSISASIIHLPEARILFSKNGWHDSVCYWLNSTSETSKFLSWFFVLSKMVELFDTVFIVLRKKPLTFLHWYHHSSVLVYTWYTFSQQSSAVPWYIIMNYCVHSIMYSYYGLRAMNFKISKTVAMTITTLQLVQMVLGLAVNIYAYKMVTNNIECGTPLQNIQISFAMYASYFLLFIQFFYKAYFTSHRISTN